MVFDSASDAVERWVLQAARYVDSSRTPAGVETMIRSLDDLVPFRREAVRYRDQILSLVAAHGADLAQRSCLPAHLTASAALLRVDDYSMAVMEHAKLHRWLQPGGHADGNLDLAHVALTEAQEETGIENLQLIYPAIDCDIHEVPYRGPITETMRVGSTVQHLDVRFLVLAEPDAVFIGNHESNQLRWVRPGQLGQLTDERNLLQLFETAVMCTKAFRTNPQESHMTPSR